MTGGSTRLVQGILRIKKKLLKQLDFRKPEFRIRGFVGFLRVLRV